MKTFSIGQVAKQTGVRSSAIRYYEDAGILPRPARSNGRRVYDAETLRRIGVLRFAQQAGFTLEEIKTLFHGFGATTPLSARWHALARQKLRELDLLAAHIERMRGAIAVGLKCGCVRIEDCSLRADDASEMPLLRGRSRRKHAC